MVFDELDEILVSNPVDVNAARKDEYPHTSGKDMSIYR
jgi:hypothetical protein